MSTYLNEQEKDRPTIPSDLSPIRLIEDLVKSAPQGILVLDKTGKILFYNPKAFLLFHAKEKLIGRSIYEFCWNEDDLKSLQTFLETPPNPKQTPFFHTPFPFQFRTDIQNDIHLRLYSEWHEDFVFLYMEDNSEILTLEQELRSFKTAIQSADDAIFIFDERGMIFFTNPAFEEQVGLPLEQILGSEIQCFWSDLDKPEVHIEIWRCIQNAWPWSGEMTWLRGNRSTYNVEVRMTPILTEEKKVVGFICVQRDITQRKKIEKQLLDYSDNLERMVAERTEELANLHDITQLFHSTETLDKRLRLLLISATADEVFRFNRAFLLLVDKKHENLVGRIAFGPSSPEEAGMIWNRVKSLPHAESLADTLQTYLDYAGEGENRANQIARRLSVPLSQDSSILVQAIRQRCAFVVKEGKTEVDFDPIILQQLENDHFAVVPMLVQNEPIGVLVVDNIINRRPIAEDDVQLLEILTAQAALAIAHAEAMQELARKIKEIETAYAELRSSQEKLIEASKFAALGQMAATVAHEIRTPLVAIGGFVNLLLKKRQSSDPEFTHLKIVRDEALRLEDVLNRLLFYARPSLPQLEPHDIQPLIDSVLSLLDSEMKEYGITVEKLFAPVPPFAFDRNQIRQVLMNIFQNGIQSMENGGKLFIETQEENGQVFIKVQDTGVGIAPENLSRIFEPFFSTKHAGTGLGMHVSQRIIQSHGGSIFVKSRLGTGTEVTIRLPRKLERLP